MQKKISRRRFLVGTGAGIALGTLTSISTKHAKANVQKAGPRPNILYLHTHDIGRYCEPYGFDIPAPNMLRLAKEGVLFRNAFSAAPTCSPARAALLTGQSPHSSGMLGLAHRGFELNDHTQHIAHTLRKAGYHSALIGTQHITRDATQFYDDVVNYHKIEYTGENKHPKYIRAEKVTRAAEKWLQNPPEQPFFLSVGYNLTHRKYLEPGEAEDPRYCRPPAVIPDTPGTRADMASFKASVRVLDKMYGRVLEALKAGGLEKNTLVICTTEHGIAFPSMKCNLTDHGTGVMLIMRGPGGFTGGRVCDVLISQIDVFPSVCELLQIERPPWLQGKSFLPVIRGETTEINEEIFSDVTYHAAYEPMRAVRTHRWKYIRRFSSRSRPVLCNCDDGPSKTVWLEHGWKDRPVAQEQLYDLVFDPVEVNNLAEQADGATQQVLQEMRGRLQRWMQQTNDPLLAGTVRPRQGQIWKVNKPDSISPDKYVYEIKG